MYSEGEVIAKRILLTALVLLFLILSFAVSGCSAESFDVYYDMESESYGLGDAIKLELSAKNTGSRFSYSGVPDGSALLFLDKDGERYYIYPEPTYIPATAGNYVCHKGDVLSFGYCFVVPQEVPAGKYSMDVWVFGIKTTFTEIIEIGEY